MRLIDADNLKERVSNAIIEDEHILEIIDEVPTAYDVGKVVEQLEEYSTPEIINTIAGKKVVKVVSLEDGKRIVKEGGLNGTREQEEILSRK